jgi:hypothetical protein
MRSRFLILAAAILIFVQGAALAEPIGRNDRDVESAAKDYIKSVVDAYNSQQYAKMAMNFGENMFSDFPQATFDKLMSTVMTLSGKIKVVKYLGFITQLDYTVIIYKAETEKSEMFIKLSLSDDNGKVSIIGVWFQ